MNWRGTRVIVTGAGGFIGSHLTERLVELGAELTAFVRYNSRGDEGLLRLLPPQVHKSLRIIRGDLKDPDAVNAAVKGQQVVFHLGALIGIPYSYVHPMDYVQTNAVGTMHVLLACREHGVQCLVHTSTSEVYGTARKVPMDETHPLQGQSPYSASKIAADQLAFSFGCAFDLPVVTVRPFNTYGPRQSSRAVIPTIIVQALKNQPIRLGSLTPTRDLTFVRDTAAGFIRAAEVPEARGQTINLGCGQEISIGELARKICVLAGVEPRIEVDPERLRPGASEVERLLASTEKAKTLLRWSPTVTLEDGLKQTVDWLRQNLSLYGVEAYHV
jgi:NAD dependent epimerase/dehydratase